MKKWIFAFGLAVAMMQSSHADDCQGAMTATLNNMSDAANYGRAVANNCKDQAIQSTIEQNAMYIAQQVDANYDHSNAQYYDKDLNVSLAAGNQKVNKCSGDLSGLSNKDKADCEAVEFAAKNGNQRPKYNLDHNNDPLIVNSKEQINDAKIEGNQSFCRVVRNTIPATYERKQCLSTSGTIETSCHDVVNVSNCVTPTEHYRVAAGGVNRGTESVMGSNGLDAQVSFVKQELRLSAQGRMPRNVSRKTVDYAFEIKNLAHIDQAVILRYNTRNGIRVFVNNTLVLEDGRGRSSDIHPKTDLKSALQEGTNIIRVESARRGLFWASDRERIFFVLARVDFDLSIDIPVYRGCEKTFTTTCAPIHQNAKSCQLVKKTCEEPSQEFFGDVLGSVDKKPLGYCKKQSYEMVCAGELNINECSELDTQGCEQIASECTEHDSDGKCVTYNQTYQCQKTKERVIETTQCEDMLCHGEHCVPQKAEADGDFGMAVAMLEAQRQAGMYGKTEKGYNIFDGDPSVCSVKVFAGHNLMSCCKEISTGDKFKNRTQGGNTVTYGNEPNTPLTDTRGSQYVYDQVFNENKMLANIQSALTFGWLQCNSEEKMLAIKRGSGLCEYSHQWCSKKAFFGSCLERKRQYCCFRSVLAKIINKQGNVQLGKKGCDGFTLEELQKLDFSKMDFSEFINQIVPADIDVEGRKKQVEQTIEKKFGKEVSYYDR